MLGTIPYRIPVHLARPFDLKTFGLCVAVGVVAGIWVTARLLPAGVRQEDVYEGLHLVALAALLRWVVARAAPRFAPGAAVALFCGWCGSARFATDTLRAYDERVAGPDRRAVAVHGPDGKRLCTWDTGHGAWRGCLAGAIAAAVARAATERH